jgi:hypothetical protein
LFISSFRFFKPTPCSRLTPSLPVVSAMLIVRLSLRHHELDERTLLPLLCDTIRKVPSLRDMSAHAMHLHAGALWRACLGAASGFQWAAAGNSALFAETLHNFNVLQFAKGVCMCVCGVCGFVSPKFSSRFAPLALSQC